MALIIVNIKMNCPFVVVVFLIIHDITNKDWRYDESELT